MNNENVKMPPKYDQILTIIKEHQGRAQAISYKKIAQMVNLHSRTVREYVADLIKQFGEPIGTNYDCDCGGYYWATKPWELNETCEKFHSHALGILKREADLKGMSYAEMAGQLALELQDR